MKTILRIILAISFSLLLVGLANAQNMQFDLYSDADAYARDCNLCSVSNLEKYTDVEVYAIWTNNQGFDSLTYKINLNLENGDVVTMETIRVYQKPFEYIVSGKDLPKLKASEVEYIELIVMGSGLNFRKETKYRKGMYNTRLFINHLTNE
jgi:hypothetical protein